VTHTYITDARAIDLVKNHYWVYIVPSPYRTSYKDSPAKGVIDGLISRNQPPYPFDEQHRQWLIETLKSKIFGYRGNGEKDVRQLMRWYQQAPLLTDLLQEAT
jgi:hypothetical protein